jgi:4-amino-4-deoxy-L-arabinose transferase-like glycosyltransferase
VVDAPRFGPAAGLLAATLCAFDLNLIAHGRYVTTDFPITVFYFFSCMLWVEYLEDGGLRRLLPAAFTIALAMVIKFSAVLLIPTLIALYAICWVQRPEAPMAPRGPQPGTQFWERWRL